MGGPETLPFEHDVKGKHAESVVRREAGDCDT